MFRKRKACSLAASMAGADACACTATWLAPGASAISAATHAAVNTRVADTLGV
jgi:hypothetical protein